MPISVNSCSDETLNRGFLALLLRRQYEFPIWINIVQFSFFSHFHPIRTLNWLSYRGFHWTQKNFFVILFVEGVWWKVFLIKNVDLINICTTRYKQMINICQQADNWMQNVKMIVWGRYVNLSMTVPNSLIEKYASYCTVTVNEWNPNGCSKDVA